MQPAAEPPSDVAQRTETLTEREHPPITLAAREPVTSLRYLGKGAAPLLLPGTKRRFTIGSGACDLVVPRDLSTSVSGFHALIERAGSELVIRDQRSKNGVYPARMAPRASLVQVGAGMPFWLGDLGLLPMDAHLDVLRPVLARSVGLEAHEAIDQALEQIAAGGPLALLGPPGLGAMQLARAIHAAGPRRNNFYLQVDEAPMPSLAQVYGGTVCVDLDAIRMLPAPQAAALLDERQGLRAIFVARNERRVWQCLDHHRTKVTLVRLVPLTERRDDVTTLLAMHWIEELRTGRRVEELGPGLARIAQHAWPRNLDELHEHSPRLLAYLLHGSLRPAAASLGVTRQTLGDHFKRIGFPVSERKER